jgi:hypothetical protein
VSGFGLFVTTGPVGVMTPPQPFSTTGGTGCVAWAGHATVAAPFAGTVKSGYAGSVNVEVQVVVNGAHELVYVQVTVLVTGCWLHIVGAGKLLLFVNTPLQPPLAVAEVNHAA